METEDQRYERYLRQNKGVWFASCSEMDEWAKTKVREGAMKPLSDLIPGKTSTKYWYVESRFTKTEDLLVYFSPTGMYHMFGIYDYCLDYQI